MRHNLHVGKSSKTWAISVFAFLFLCLSFCARSQSNEITVTGKVTSDTSALENVSVQLKSNLRNMVATDEKGRYAIRVPSNGTLVFSIVGFQNQEVAILGRPTINVIMKGLDTGLNGVTVTGFGGTQRKASLVASITTVDVKDLHTPTGNMTNTLAGRIPGMISFQRSGEPGRGTNNSQFYIRGLSTFGSGKQNPLILIDGVESSDIDMARLQPDDIASFSVLKDAAAAAVYGARGANGVILINTRSGREGITQFFVRGETRFSGNTKNFKLADNVTYMELANEAVLTRDPIAIEPYSQNKINHTKAGDDPYLYPNNNWIKQMIKPYTINQAYDMNISGGGTKARYFVSGSYSLDNGVLRQSDINTFNNNIRLANYSLRTNFNLNVSNTTELIVHMYAQFDDYKGPVDGGGAIFQSALTANPVMFPAVYPQSKLPYIDHPLFGSAQTYNFGSGTQSKILYVNPYSDLVKGYKTYKASNIQPQLELRQNFNFITEGLSGRVMGYLRRQAYYGVSRSYNPFYYQSVIDPTTGTYTLKVLNDGGTSSIGTPGTEYLGYKEDAKTVDSRAWLEGSINYNHLFAEKHSVGGSLISYMSSYESGNAGGVTASLPQRNQGVSGRFTYGFDDRYLAEFDFGYNGSERFAKNYRFGFFPSYGLGYRISNEKFFAPLKRWVNDMKIRATYGTVGNDQIGNVNDRFFYLSNVNLNDGGYGASFGRNDGVAPYSRPGVSISRYENKNITWELSRQLNLGLDLRMFNALNVTVEVYKQQRSQILQPKSYIENALGLTAIPASNYGKASSQGIDLTLQYEKSLSRNSWVNARGTLTYATSKLLLSDQIKQPANLYYLSTVGYSLSQAWGYIAERLFVDDKEVANSPVQFGNNGLRAGDIKYRDVSGDGIINTDDVVPIGHPLQPEIIYGFGASMGYKAFDFSFYFQGSARSSFFIDPGATQPYVQVDGRQNTLLKAIADNHWSESNQNLYAFWPRLSSYSIASNNTADFDFTGKYTSTWWMRSGNFLRLKSVDMGYTFKDFKGIKLKAPRIYFSASNLFLISSFKLWDVEMGGNGLSYPVQSVYSLGAQLNF